MRRISLLLLVVLFIVGCAPQSAQSPTTSVQPFRIKTKDMATTTFYRLVDTEGQVVCYYCARGIQCFTFSSLGDEAVTAILEEIK